MFSASDKTKLSPVFPLSFLCSPVCLLVSVCVLLWEWRSLLTLWGPGAMISLCTCLQSAHHRCTMSTPVLHPVVARSLTQLLTQPLWCSDPENYSSCSFQVVYYCIFPVCLMIASHLPARCLPAIPARLQPATLTPLPPFLPSHAPPSNIAHLSWDPRYLTINLHNFTLPLRLCPGLSCSTWFFLLHIIIIIIIIIIINIDLYSGQIVYFTAVYIEWVYKTWAAASLF